MVKCEICRETITCGTCKHEWTGECWYCVEFAGTIEILNKKIEELQRKQEDFRAIIDGVRLEYREDD